MQSKEKHANTHSHLVISPMEVMKWKWCNGHETKQMVIHLLLGALGASFQFFFIGDDLSWLLCCVCFW